MRLEIDEHAWKRGFEDGEQGLPLRSCPYAVGTTESWSRHSGYIQGKAARNGYAATRPTSLPREKCATAAEPCAVPLRSKAQGSAADDPGQGGVNIARRSGVKVRRRLTLIAVAAGVALVAAAVIGARAATAEVLQDAQGVPPRYIDRDYRPVLPPPVYYRPDPGYAASARPGTPVAVYVHRVTAHARVHGQGTFEANRWRARTEAIEKWRAHVTRMYGPGYSRWWFARDKSIICDGGAYAARCEVSALPVRAPWAWGSPPY